MAAGICHIPALCFFFQKTKGTLAAALISPNNAACKTKADSIAIYLKRKSIFKLVTASTKIMTENVKKYTFAIYAQDFPYNSHTLPSCAAKTKVKPSPCPLSILRTLCTNTSKASSQFCRNADPSLARPIAETLSPPFRRSIGLLRYRAPASPIPASQAAKAACARAAYRALRSFLRAFSPSSGMRPKCALEG